MSEELKPCAHCGNGDVQPIHECNSNKPLYRIKCYVCGMQTHLDDKEKVIAAWNRRAEPIGNSDELPEWLRKKIWSELAPIPTKTQTHFDMGYKTALQWVLSRRKPESEP